MAEWKAQNSVLFCQKDSQGAIWADLQKLFLVSNWCHLSKHNINKIKKKKKEKGNQNLQFKIYVYLSELAVLDVSFWMSDCEDNKARIPLF